MTKKEAIAEYTALYYGDEFALKQELAHGDKVRARCGLLDYFDCLARDGRITEKQRQTWTAPKGWY